MKHFLYMCMFIISGALPILSPARADTPPTSEAVIVMFHRFGQDTHPSTNVTLEQVRNFIAYIQDNGFTVRPLQQVVSAIQNGDRLPPKTVAITIDDAYKSIYTYAYPLFKDANFPFTVFLSSREMGFGNFLSWEQVAEMAQNGADFQAHTHSHPHMTQLSIAQNIEEIQKNIQLIEKHTGIRPTLFAYPYGEANTDIINTVKNMGFTAGFSQHSGVFNATSDMFYIPRFSLNERYATPQRIQQVLNARAFPITSFTPTNPQIDTINPPKIQFTVANNIASLHNMGCFYNGTAKMQTHIEYPTVTLTFDTPFTVGRHRINCTAPHPDNRGYRWLGMQFVVDE